MADAPIRLTRGRAEALLTIFEIGFRDELEELGTLYDVHVHPETLEVSPRGGALEFFWADAGSEAELRENIERLRGARAAAAIIQRRYLS